MPNPVLLAAPTFPRTYGRCYYERKGATSMPAAVSG